MKVELLQCTPDFLQVIWCAARTCYSSLSPLELWRAEVSREEKLRLARQVINSGHLSVTEHCTMTFGVEGVSRTLLAQYSRHRIGVSLSVQSQRHVRAGDAGEGVFAHVVPPRIQGNPEAEDLFFTAMDGAQTYYDRLVALGIRKEDARFVLPGGAATNFVTSLNLRSLMDVYQKRVAIPGAQWEIKAMVQEMADLIVAREPWLAEYFSSEVRRD
ncbi:MAG: FAD-dependent thymidylate synthase [Clostridia bacterium]|nr:MAG: FAD-dependent thymidylate synthase [Clostridia bacterium]